MSLATIILAAGHGIHMKSERPKILHPLAGRPMVMYSIEAVRDLSADPPVLVVGSGDEQIREVLGDAVRYVVQEDQLGTGHAVAQCRALLGGQAGQVLVCYADMPLLHAETLRKLFDAQADHSSPLSMLTCEADDAHGLGRIVRSKDGRVLAFVEEGDATEEERQIREINAGAYCFDGEWLWSHLDQISPSPEGEYYLTNLIGLAVKEGAVVNALMVDDPNETLGINTRIDLAQAEDVLRRRINERWMLAGVTLIDPATAYIDAGATIGPDTVVYPNTHIWGTTTIGRDCTLGPNTILRDATIGNGCRIDSSIVEGATLEDDVDVGPFAHLRKGAHLESGVHMGNFGEIKNARLRRGVKMGHFSYIGDADIGAETNIGAGTITCNFDGVRKNRTVVGPGAFIGSDTMLVAPLTLGKGARTGAGAVVTKDVPDNRLAVGMPARIRKASPPDEPKK